MLSKVEKKLHLVYIEFGGDMECHECLYVGYRLCRGNTREEVLEDYNRQHGGVNIEQGTWYGRYIQMIEVPEVSSGRIWGDLKIVDSPKEKKKLKVMCINDLVGGLTNGKVYCVENTFVDEYDETYYEVTDDYGLLTFYKATRFLGVE